MTVAKVGKERIIDIVDADITTAKLGTGTTSPTEADTDLETPIAATDASTTNVQGTKILNVGHILNSGTGTGNSYTEFVVYINSILFFIF